MVEKILNIHTMQKNYAFLMSNTPLESIVLTKGEINSIKDLLELQPHQKHFSVQPKIFL